MVVLGRDIKVHVQGMFILCLTSDKVVGSFQV